MKKNKSANVKKPQARAGSNALLAADFPSQSEL